MQVPIEIRFHGLEPSESLESEVRAQAERLNRLYGRLTACRVSIEPPPHQRRTGNLWNVHIELSVPGKTLVVSREPHKAHLRHARPDIRKAVKEAFKAAERQLKEFKQVRRGEVKPHDVPLQGQVASLDPAGNYGFLITNTGGELYFSRTSVMNDGFDRLKVGDTVHYSQIDGDSGPVANKVWQAPSHNLD
jgi:cold shock CspA family protein